MHAPVMPGSVCAKALGLNLGGASSTTSATSCIFTLARAPEKARDDGAVKAVGMTEARERAMMSVESATRGPLAASARAHAFGIVRHRDAHILFVLQPTSVMQAISRRLPHNFLQTTLLPVPNQCPVRAP